MARAVGGCPPELAPFLATMPTPWLAKTAGVSGTTVIAWKRRAGVTPDAPGCPRSRLSPADTSAAIDALRAAANAPSDKALARHIGVWRDTINHARHDGVSADQLHRWALRVEQAGVMPPPTPRYSADEVWDITEGLRISLRPPTLAELARRLGVARHTVANARQIGAPTALIDAWRTTLKESP